MTILTEKKIPIIQGDNEWVLSDLNYCKQPPFLFSLYFCVPKMMLIILYNVPFKHNSFVHICVQTNIPWNSFIKIFDFFALWPPAYSWFKQNLIRWIFLKRFAIKKMISISFVERFRLVRCSNRTNVQNLNFS